MPASSPVSQALVPMLAGYLLIMIALGAGLRLLARSIDYYYYYGATRVAGDFITSAFTGTAMLIAIALPLWGRPRG